MDRPVPEWASRIPEGSFVSYAPTYEEGKYLNLYGSQMYSENDFSMKYYFFDPTKHGYDPNGTYPLLIFLHGYTNALVGDLCVTYAGAEYYGSPDYQKALGGAYVLVPLANEKEVDGKCVDSWSDEYVPILDRLIRGFCEARAANIGKKIVLGNSSGAGMVFQMACTYPEFFDVAVPVAAGGFPEDTDLHRLEENNVFLFYCKCRNDEFTDPKDTEARIARLENQKNCFIFAPEWVRNGDHGVASINFGTEMGQHCLMNAVHSNLMFDDGTPMDERLPNGLTGWIAAYCKQ